MPITDDTPTIYCTRTNRIIDTCLPSQEDADTKLARHKAAYGPDLIVVPFSEAWDRHEAAVRSEPQEITVDKWDYALNVLPPVSWKNDGDTESFKISERLTGAITAIYVRLGERYFTFNDDIRTPHTECCRRVVLSLAYASPPAPQTYRKTAGDEVSPSDWMRHDDLGRDR